MRLQHKAVSLRESWAGLRRGLPNPHPPGAQVQHNEPDSPLGEAWAGGVGWGCSAGVSLGPGRRPGDTAPPARVWTHFQGLGLTPSLSTARERPIPPLPLRDLLGRQRQAGRGPGEVLEQAEEGLEGPVDKAGLQPGRDWPPGGEGHGQRWDLRREDQRSGGSPT